MLMGADVAFHTNCVTTRGFEARTVVASATGEKGSRHDEPGAPERHGSGQLEGPQVGARGTSWVP
jgi:hypothetical protein